MSEQPELKRQRVDEDEGEDLGSESSSGSEGEGEEGGNGSKEQEAFRANDMIDLIFVEPDSTDYLLALPQYTHQLFDEEGHLEEVTFMEAPDECRVSVYVRCSDYRHLVGIPAGSSEEEQTQLLTRIKKGIPSCAEVFPLRGNNNDDNEEEDEAFTARVDTFVSELPSKEEFPQGPAVGPGKLIGCFTQGTDKFEMYLASAKDAGVATLVRRAESLAMWFIETADSVDFSDERWTVLLLFRRCECTRDAAGRRVPGEALSLSGYVTLFKFNNPFAGAKLRICQALVLPHLQGKGLGREMLLCIYQHVREQDGTVEITVEDPAPGFQTLRDAVDLEWCYKQIRYPANSSSPSISDTEVASSAKDLKITRAQMEYVEEAERYAVIVQSNNSIVSSGDQIAAVDNANTNTELENLLRPFRLSVKRRLLRANPDLKNLPKPAMQKQLEELYVEQQNRFDKSIKTRARLLKAKI